MEFHPETEVISPMEFRLENLSSLFLNESEHMPSEQYTGNLTFGNFNVAVRQEIIAFISQLCSGFDRLISYLSVNYLNRFLSSQKLPQTKPWALRLIAMSCVSLAAKTQGLNISLSDLQGSGGLTFESAVQKVEVLILGALEWRMQPITPFSFIPFFISLFQLQELPSRQALTARATEIIFRAQTDISLLGFKPSIAAASALLCASNELFPQQFSSFWDTVSDCSYVNKDHLEQCYHKMQRAAVEGRGSVHDSASRSGTPCNVLEQHYFRSSSNSEQTVGTSRRALERQKTSGSAVTSASSASADD